jgi:signal transduction histidine kinase
MVIDTETYLRELIGDFHHDFRSILSNLLGYVEFLRDHQSGGGGTPPLQLEKQPQRSPLHTLAIEVILKNAQRLKLMADNLAAEARGEITKNEDEWFDLQELIEESVSFHTFAAHDAGLSLHFEKEQTGRGDPTPPFAVKGSRLMIASLVDNLLANAIKYTPAGGKVTLRCGRKVGGVCPTPLQKERNTVTFSIEDTGIGISGEDLPFIFERYHRGSGQGRKRQGLGLGLAICKRIVDAHQGSMQVSSELGKGTCFTVYLPAVG